MLSAIMNATNAKIMNDIETKKLIQDKTKGSGVEFRRANPLGRCYCGEFFDSRPLCFSFFVTRLAKSQRAKRGRGPLQTVMLFNTVRVPFVFLIRGLATVAFAFFVGY